VGTESTDLTQAADATAPGSRERAKLVPGTLIGRYVIVERIGSGGMGIVYSAFDPELDRKLALKLLRPTRARDKGKKGRARLQREAQALAQIQHPNVVAVHDVGTYEDQVFIAMEFVEGPTLREWIDDKARTSSEVLDVLLPAGEGLVAAHAKGMVHRDFKPDNVILGDDRRVRVMDFGLARSASEGTSGAPEGGSPGADAQLSSSFSVELTDAGALLGTPAYMSPEQHRGETADERSDQFSFCVVLYEALFGKKPFAGKTIAALSLSITEGRLTEPPASSKVPGWIRKAVLRGLSREPGDRWPNMSALLAELRRDPRRARRRWALLFGTALAVAGAFGGAELREQRQAEACRSEGAQINEVWNDEARERLRRRILGTERSYAARTFEYVALAYDEYAAQWSTAAEQTCLSAQASGVARADDSVARERRAVACLDERREAASMLLSSLEDPQPGDADLGIEKAASAAADLPLISQCTDEAWLMRGVLDPEDDSGGTARQARKLLVEAETLHRLARYEASVARARESVEIADQTVGPTLRGRARLQLGRSLLETGPFDEAESTLESCYMIATRGADDQTAALCASLNGYLVGYQLKRAEAGHLWTRLAEVSLDRAGHGETLARANWHSNSAAVDMADGAAKQAIDHYQQSSDIRCGRLGDDHPQCSRLKINLAMAHLRNGERARARELLERALSEEEARVGPSHPNLSMMLETLAQIASREQRASDSLAYAKRSVEILEASVGADNPQLGKAYANLANALPKEQRKERIDLYERALTIIKKHYGETHPWVGGMMVNIALIHVDLEEYEQAQQVYKDALALQEKSLGSEHVDLISTLFNLADAHSRAGEHEDAIREAERAVEIRKTSSGADHPQFGVALLPYARVLRLAGRHQDALAHLNRALEVIEASEEKTSLDTAHLEMGRLRMDMERPQLAVKSIERALDVRTKSGASPEARAQTQFALAEALWEIPEDRGRAISLAQVAMEGYRESGATSELALVDAWLAAHGRP
jgi:tetratricopeptide (TPR) repeat protein/predicted Ser/Thr protein kinase